MSMPDARVYDFERARRLRDELAGIAESHPLNVSDARRMRVGSSVNGQLSLDPLTSLSGGIVIDGMHFHCTVWGGGGGATGSA